MSSPSSSKGKKGQHPPATQDILCVFCTQSIHARMHAFVTFPCTDQAHLGCLTDSESGRRTEACIKCLEDGSIASTAVGGRAFPGVSDDPFLLDLVFQAAEQARKGMPSGEAFGPGILEYGSLSPGMHGDTNQTYSAPLYTNIEDQVFNMLQQLRANPQSGVIVRADSDIVTTEDRFVDHAATVHVLNMQRVAQGVNLWAQLSQSRQIQVPVAGMAGQFATKQQFVTDMERAQEFKKQGFMLLELLTLLRVHNGLPDVRFVTLHQRFGIRVDFIIGMDATLAQLLQMQMNHGMLTEALDDAKTYLVSQNNLKYWDVLMSPLCESQTANARWTKLFQLRFPPEALKLMGCTMQALMSENVTQMQDLSYVSLKDFIEQLGLRQGHISVMAQKFGMDVKKYGSEVMGWTPVDMRQLLTTVK